MKRFIPTACLAAAFAVGLSAQTPSPAPAGQPPSPAPAGQPPSSAPQAQASGGKNVTVTGCLKAGDEPGSFALSNVKTAAAKDAPGATPPATTGTTGTAGSAASLESASSVKLTGSPAGGNLAEHVGHTVRISGAVSAAAPSGGAAAGDKPAAGAPAAKAGPSIEVSSISMVSASCSM